MVQLPNISMMHACKDNDSEPLPEVAMDRLNRDIKRHEASNSSAVAATTEVGPGVLFELVYNHYKTCFFS